MDAQHMPDGGLPLPVPPRPTDAPHETYNPWSIVNLVFRHLASEGLHPVLGETGDPGAPAAQLLQAFGITPAHEGSRQVSVRTAGELARLRAAFEASRGVPGDSP